MDFPLIFGLGATLTFTIVAYQDYKERRVSRAVYLLFAALSVCYSLMLGSWFPLFFAVILLIIAAPFNPFKPADILIFLGFSGLEQSIVGIAAGLGVIIWSNAIKRRLPVGLILLSFFFLTALWRWLL